MSLSPPKSIPSWGLILAVSVLAAGVGIAAAGPGHPLGWSTGTPAAGTAALVAPAPGSAQRVTLPKEVARRVRGPTLLFYFAPDCSHCRDVAPELAALAAQLGKDTRVLLVATARSTKEEVTEYVETFALERPWLIDEDAELSAALGARSTPVAVLLDRGPDGIVELERWSPYRPGSDALVKMRVRGEPWSVMQEGGFLGNDVCAACHTEETQAWELSHHSIAWRTLVLSGGSRDEECTDCHVTGAHQPGGWQGIGQKSMVNVGCESCHGAAGPHDGQPTESTSTCAACHDADHSIDFSPAKGLPHLDHYAANGLDDDALAEARRALLGGEAPRPLLAFGDGPTVGAEACAECHADATAWWRHSGHGGAMAALTESDQAQDVDCVRCHATRAGQGTDPAALSSYRVDEGVGCESCHGPGGDHVAAGGGVSNIVGLGSSCPVCVIEGVCTSCHTPKWDKDWELTTELARVAHHAPVAPPPDVDPPSPAPEPPR